MEGEDQHLVLTGFFVFRNRTSRSTNIDGSWGRRNGYLLAHRWVSRRSLPPTSSSNPSSRRLCALTVLSSSPRTSIPMQLHLPADPSLWLPAMIYLFVIPVSTRDGRSDRLRRVGTSTVDFASLCSCPFQYCFSWGPVPWVYCAEIFPMRLRHYG